MKKIALVLCLAMVPTASSAMTFAGPVERELAGISQDDIFTHSEAGVQFQLPKGWKAKPDGEVITVSSADDSLQVVLWVPDEATFDAAVKELDNELSKTIKNIKVTGKPTQDTHNGMAHYEETGTGEVDGATIMWSVDVLAAKKPLIILTFGAPNLFEKHADAYVQFANSIKKIS